MFNIGDLVQLNYSEHIGIVIDKRDWAGANHANPDRNAIPGSFGNPRCSYRIKWAVGEPFTWEKPECLLMKARVGNEEIL